MKTTYCGVPILQVRICGLVLVKYKINFPKMVEYCIQTYVFLNVCLLISFLSPQRMALLTLLVKISWGNSDKATRLMQSLAQHWYVITEMTHISAVYGSLRYRSNKCPLEKVK